MSNGRAMPKRMLMILAALAATACATDRAPVRDPIPTRPLDECGEIDLGRIGPIDVAFVIETSAFTADASGADIDGNGNVGKPRDVFYGSPFLGSTDPADSLLSAQVIATNSIAQLLEFSDAKLSVVSYAARSVRDVPPTTRVRHPAKIEIKRRTRTGHEGLVELVHSRRPTDASIETDVTPNSTRVRIALASVFDMKSAGGTKFSSAMLLAVRSLQSDTDGIEARRKVALLTGVTPTARIFDPNGSIIQVDPEMKIAAQIALDSGVAFNTFGLAEAASADPPTALSRIAGATGGSYHAVKDASQLYCTMLRSLVPPAPPTPL